MYHRHIGLGASGSNLMHILFMFILGLVLAVTSIHRKVRR